MKRALALDRLAGLAVTGGLSTAEVESRRKLYGTNDIIAVRPRRWAELARETVRDPMLWFLAATSCLYLALGQYAEAGVLLVALIPLTGMDAFLHHRTAASTEGLSARLAARARVERDGELIEVPASALVPGDLAVISAGEWFPADGLIVAGRELQCDESSLTGEAYPVVKRPYSDLLRGTGTPMVEQEHWGLAGTRLLTGEARLRVVWTGGGTLYGEIVRSALQGSGARTPLQQAISNLVLVLILGAVVMCLTLAFVRLRQGYGWIDALLSAVTLAVAAIPEEFPVVFTFFLGVGVYRLAQRQALVRRAVSVENIGRVSCICSDKTGTITEGRLHLTHVLPAPEIDERRLLTLARYASRTDSGDPLDEAINRAAQERCGGESVEGVAVFPFTESRKRESAVIRQGNGALLSACKGAGEVVLQLCELSAGDRQSWTEKIGTYAAEGHKVIGCAWRALDGDWAGGEPDRGLHWAGMLALEDPVRPGVPEAIQQCRAAGIHVVMVTGDHPATAAAIAREVGLADGQPRVISGDDVDAMLERGEREQLRDIDVIARAVPAQKLGLVQARQALGDLVAVTGDGVNDVPALQAADIGIAMGQRGTRSAREVAAIVLLDDNFRSIVRAISEGQQLFENLRLSFQYLLMVHLPLVITAAVIPLAGFPLLYLPVHIVWLEMVIHPSALLVFQERGRDHLQPPRGRGAARFFAPRDWLVMTAAAALIITAVIGLYVRALDAVRPVEHARATAMAALTLCSAGIVAGLSQLRSAVSRWISGGTVALTLALVQVPAVSRLLHMEPLHADDWLLVAASSIVAAALPALVLTWHRQGP
jgi:Ca2+-transporting ATPase